MINSCNSGFYCLVTNHECSIDSPARTIDEKLGLFLDRQIPQLLILGRNRIDERKSQMRSSSSGSRIANHNRS
ncbi:MAG: hypothetical protein ABI180_10200 [Microcoleus sp.]